MKKNMSFIVAVGVLALGIVLLLGSSYSLINSTVTEESYGFNVASFNVEFQDRSNIQIKTIPISDEEGKAKSKEFSFTVNNTSNNDVNYRLDILENSTYPMADVIKYTYSLNNGEYTDIYRLSKNNTISQNRVLPKGEKDTYKIKFWLSIEADEEYMNKAFSAVINLSATQNEYKYATNTMESLANNNLDGIKKVGSDYRYSSMDNNYVWFNCTDSHTKGEEYCEKWHILGSFDNNWENGVGTYKSLKIMRDEVYDEISFNNKEKTGDYNNSYINMFLNGAYYDKLNSKAQELILRAKWNIGKVEEDNYTKAFYDETLKNYYANIGLINVSDYLYLQNSFPYENILSLNKNDDKVIVLNKNNITTASGLQNFSIIPCLYLKPDVSILSGDGSVNNPYELGIKFPMTYGIK